MDITRLELAVITDESLRSKVYKGEVALTKEIYDRLVKRWKTSGKYSSTGEFRLSTKSLNIAREKALESAKKAVGLSYRSWSIEYQSQTKLGKNIRYDVTDAFNEVLISSLGDKGWEERITTFECMLTDEAKQTIASYKLRVESEKADTFEAYVEKHGVTDTLYDIGEHIKGSYSNTLGLSHKTYCMARERLDNELDFFDVVMMIHENYDAVQEYIDRLGVSPHNSMVEEV